MIAKPGAPRSNFMAYWPIQPIEMGLPCDTCKIVDTECGSLYDYIIS